MSGIYAASPTAVFAVSPSEIVRWDGQSWSRAPDVFTDFSAIWGANENDVWAVGLPDSWEFPSGRSATAHWDGKSWSFTSSSAIDNTLWSVWGTGSNDVWAISVGLANSLAHFDGRAWSWATSSSPGALLNGRLGGGRGGAVFVTNYGEIAQLAGGVWQRRSSGQLGNVYGLWMQSPSDGWVLTDGTIWHWDGSTFSTSVVVPGTTLYAIYGTRPDDVWAVGYGVIVHWNGVEWTTTKTNDGPYLFSVWGSSPGDVWATTSGIAPGGKVLHNDGSGWTVAMSSATSIRSVWGSAANDVWIGGDGGSVIHWNGGAWTTIATPVARLGQIAGSGPNDVWAIGDAGVVVHWDGTSWTLSPGSDAVGQLVSLAVVGPTNVWAVGSNGALAHWDGTAWTRSRVNYNLDLRAVFVSSDGATWIGGIGGAILRRRVHSIFE
jgi:hypothetical protein